MTDEGLKMDNVVYVPLLGYLQLIGTTCVLPPQMKNWFGVLKIHKPKYLGYK